MTWRTGTKNPHALYFDEGATSIPHGFLAHPEVAKRIAEAMNDRDKWKARAEAAEDPMREQTWSGRFRVLTERAEKAESELATLRAQLPDGMQHCTIRFLECPVGHGRLTADNWITSGCLACELTTMRAEVERLRAQRAYVSQGGHWCAQSEALLDSHPKCAVCGKPASCMGFYKSDGEWGYTCDECCGHEDGECFPLYEIPARYQGLLTRQAALEEVASSPSIPAPAGCLECGEFVPTCEECLRVHAHETGRQHAALDEAAAARAQYLVERADSGEGRHDIKLVVEYLRAGLSPRWPGR